MASLIVVGRNTRKEHPLEDAVTVVGRDSGATLELGDLQLSRRHALLVRARQGYFVKDLGSRNGVLINQVRIPNREQAPLKNGDVLHMGRTTLIFKELEDAVEGAMAILDGPPTPTVVQTVAVRPQQINQLAADRAAKQAREEAPAPASLEVGQEEPASAGGAASPASASTPPRAPQPRKKASTPKRAPQGPVSADALALQTLIERSERDRQFFRNLALILFCLLIAALVLLFAYALFQRKEEPVSQAPAQASPEPQSEQPFALDERVFEAQIHPLLREKCASCHSQSGQGGGLLLASSDDSATVTANLAAVSAFVAPDRPATSPLLLKPVAVAAGGVEHGGGDVLEVSSREWTQLRDWVQALQRGASQHRPSARIVAPGAASVGREIALRGGESEGGTDYRWVLSEAPAGSQARLRGAWKETARFVPDRAGRYSVVLTVRHQNEEDSSTHTFVASDGAAPRGPGPKGAAPETPAPKAEPLAPAAGLELTQRLLGRAPTPQDTATFRKGPGPWRQRLLQDDALYARWWAQELTHLGLTGTHEPSGDPWTTLPNKLRSGRFNVLDVYYALLVGQSWSDRYPDAEKAVDVMLLKLLGPKAGQDAQLRAQSLRLLEGHKATILGQSVQGQVGLVRTLVRSRPAAEALLSRSHFRLLGSPIPDARLKAATDRFVADPSTYFQLLVEWGLAQ